MRTRNRTPNALRLPLLLFCIAALAAGMVLGVRYERAGPRPAPQEKASSRSELAVPFPEPPSGDAAEREPAAPAADARSASPRPSRAGASPKGASDLSAFRPQARSARGEDYLPGDRSLPAERLEGHLAPKAASDDDGHGVIGDVVREARRILRSVDDATLDASRRALGDIARPDDAKIRPYKDGARLHIDIPAHTVNLGGKK